MSFGPIVGVFRAFLRAAPDGLCGPGPLSGYLNILLPELGQRPERSDPPALFEAIRGGFERIAADTGSVEALAGLAHALGETLLLDGEAEQAARQFEHALALLRDVPVPFDVAQTHLRAGVARSKAGQRQQAVDHLIDAYRTARKLGTRPLATEAARELTALGEAPERRPGRKQATEIERGGLSQRQIEVLGHIALGRTDREIAQVLFLSPRTVEMHVANCLAKLNCRSRAEAIGRAGELGVLAG